MKTIQLLIEIKIDDQNISELYPNYKFNWENVDGFVEMLTSNIETPTENIVTGKFEDHLKENGYSIRVLTKNERKLNDQN